VISWTAGAVASALGLLVSFEYDLPTGPVVVCMFGLVLLASYALRRVLTRNDSGFSLRPARHG
jgi:ABC-type Mn2+/Zn2+ transport system permease subunit